MNPAEQDLLTIFYDGGCPQCIQDMHTYNRWSGDKGRTLNWVDITGSQDLLATYGIDPVKALKALHVQDENHQTRSDIEAYIVLLQRIVWLRPLAWLMGLPLIRPLLSRMYRRWVLNRLRREGRI